MKTKIWLILISAIYFSFPNSLLAGELKIYESEGTRTIITPDSGNKAPAENWSRIYDSSQLPNNQTTAIDPQAGKFLPEIKGSPSTVPPGSRTESPPNPRKDSFHLEIPLNIWH